MFAFYLIIRIRNILPTSAVINNMFYLLYQNLLLFEINTERFLYNLKLSRYTPPLENFLPSAKLFWNIKLKDADLIYQIDAKLILIF